MEAPSDLKESAAYRAERLEAERHRLEQRKAWAARRFDLEAMERLDRQLARLRREEIASTCPRGRQAGRARSPHQLRHYGTGWRGPRP